MEDLKPRNFVSPWKESDGVGVALCGWLTPFCWEVHSKIFTVQEVTTVSQYWALTPAQTWSLTPQRWSQWLVSVTLRGKLFNKIRSLNLTLSQILDNKESVQWSGEWLRIVTIDGTLTGSFLAGKLMRRIVILLHEKKMVSNMVQFRSVDDGWQSHCLFLIIDTRPSSALRVCLRQGLIGRGIVGRLVV